MSALDLRSDTVTQPTAEMRRAMAAAEVGDDVWGEDPTVNALEERAAELLGKEAGLFVSSGTMGNLVSLMAHVPRGGEIIAGAQSHIVRDEAAGHAVVVGASVLQLRDRPDGTLDPDEVAAAFRDPTDPHEPITALVTIENAHSHSGNQPIALAATRSGSPRSPTSAAFRSTSTGHGSSTRRSRSASDRPTSPRRPTRSRSACRRACRARPARSSSARRRSSAGRAAPGSCSAAGCARRASSRRPGWSRCATATPG